MNPYRETELPQTSDDGARRPLDELVLPIAILALGLVGLVVGLVCGRATEAGLGVAATLFGAYATRALVRRR